MSMTLNATIKGPLFEKKIDEVVKAAIWEQVLDKAEDRILHPSKKAQKRIGFRRNELTPRKDKLVLDVATTVAKPATWKKKRKGAQKRAGTPRPGWQEKVPDYNPRSKGTSWVKSNEAAVRKLMPNALKKYSQQVVAELS